MPRPKNAVPTYRLHKQSGQAIVTVNHNGVRKDMLLGVYNSAESKEEYRRVLANLADGKLNPGAPADITVNELCARYWKHAQEYYRHPDGRPTSELTDLRYAIRAFRERAGHMPAREFGPLAFKSVRDAMVAKGWARPTVNKHCGRVKRVVRWGVENELLPADRWEALRAVPGLAAGRTSAPEPEPVGPVDEEHYRAVLPFVRPQVRALLELLAVTGMRPGEACRVRPCDIDTAADVWVYRPAHHKTKWRGKARAVPLGAKAQAVLKPFTPTEPDAYYFSPQKAVEEQLAERTANRKTPRWPSHMRRNAAKRKTAPVRKAGRCYCPHGIEVAVARACDEAFPPPGDLARRDDETREEWEKRLTADQRERLKEWRREHHWHPNQLRHLFATTVRRLYDLEAVQVLLGHASADTSQIYAEKNLALASKVAREIG